MDINEAIELANSGDSRLMVDISFHYFDQKDYFEAAEWAEKAALAGEKQGVIMVRALNAILGEAACGIGAFEDAREHWMKVEHWARYSLENIQLNTEDRESAEHDIITAGQRMVLCYYELEQYNESIRINTFCGTEALVLKGLCVDKLAINNRNNALLRDAYELLSNLEKDYNYFGKEKGSVDERVFTKAVIALAGFYTFGLVDYLRADLNRAVELLDRAQGTIKDPKYKELIRNMRGKYRKRLFGGYQFVQ